MELAPFLAEERSIIDAALERLLPPASAWPCRLHEAMRYAVFGGGKRVRPILARAGCRVAGADPDEIIEAACALELIHTYSLVHDDLPALDDDTLRRGRPTVHVAFDEALAVMVGDALLTEGLTVLARCPAAASFAPRRAEACRLVGEAIGSRGMVGGQVEDLEATGAAPEGARGATTDGARLERIHRAKTGALIAASVELGAVLAGAADSLRRELASFGLNLGLLFQIADDILDVTGTAESLGKSPGKDAAAGKLTYPQLYGLDAARERLAGLADALTRQARGFEREGERLAALVAFVAGRDR